LRANIRVSVGSLTQEATDGFEKIYTSVIVSEEELRRVLGVNYEHHNVESQANALAKLLQEHGELDCNIIFYHQDQRNPADSRDHLVAQFTLDIPFPSRASIRVRK